jgi:hypothetical protein
MKIKKEELIKEQSQAIALSDGLYNAQIVGYMVSQRTPYNDPEGTPYEAVRFSMAIQDDNETQKIVQTPDYRLSFSERSNLYKQLASWAKSSSPDDLWSRLEKAHIVEGEEFNLDNFIGMHVSLMTTMSASKKDASKLFPTFVFTPSKKGQAYNVVKPEDDKLIPIWLPSFIEDEDVLETKCMDCCEWKRYEEKADEFGPDDNIKPTQSSRKSNKETPSWSPAGKKDTTTANDEEDAVMPEVHAETPKKTPKLKPRKAAESEEEDQDIPF